MYDDFFEANGYDNISSYSLLSFSITLHSLHSFKIASPLLIKDTSFLSYIFISYNHRQFGVISSFVTPPL